MVFYTDLFARPRPGRDPVYQGRHIAVQQPLARPGPPVAWPLPTPADFPRIARRDAPR